MKHTAFYFLMLTVVILSGCCNGRKPVATEKEDTTPVKSVVIQASNNMFVCVDMYHGDSLIANREKAADWETLKMETLDNGLKCFMAYNGKMVCSDVGGVLIANRDAVGEWESFQVNDLGGGLFSIQDYQGKYLSVNADKGGFVFADKTELGETEKFRIITK